VENLYKLLVEGEPWATLSTLKGRGLFRTYVQTKDEGGRGGVPDRGASRRLFLILRGLAARR
jgi:hypothetical protein